MFKGIDNVDLSNYCILRDINITAALHPVLKHIQGCCSKQHHAMIK